MDITASISLSSVGGEGSESGAARSGARRRAGEEELVTNARALRKDMTDVERKLWYLLRDRRLQGHKFRRQYIIGHYIADFACTKAKLIIELDGGQHSERQAYDKKRDDYLRAEGFTVLRFWNNEVTENKEGVFETIGKTLESGE